MSLFYSLLEEGIENKLQNVSDIDKLLVKDNVGKIFKYIGETFYPQGQATPIVASQPFEINLKYSFH